MSETIVQLQRGLHRNLPAIEYHADDARRMCTNTKSAILDTSWRPPAHDLTGRTFSSWTVLGFAGRNQNKVLYWTCRCTCGTVRVVHGIHLRKGHTKSCGCLKAAFVSEGRRKHGLHGCKAYESWQSMKRRCLPTYRQAKDYADRGISVCVEWSDSFEAFHRDMGDPPPCTTIDRIDNDGNYEPGNCRWATRTVQNNNRRPRSMWKKWKRRSDFGKHRK